MIILCYIKYNFSFEEINKLLLSYVVISYIIIFISNIIYIIYIDIIYVYNLCKLYYKYKSIYHSIYNIIVHYK